MANEGSKLKLNTMQRCRLHYSCCFPIQPDSNRFSGGRRILVRSFTDSLVFKISIFVSQLILYIAMSLWRLWNNLSLIILDIQIKHSFELTISIRYYGRTEQKNIVKCTFKCITFVSIFHIACATMWAVSKCLMLSWKQQGLGQVLFSYAAYWRTGPLQPS